MKNQSVSDFVAATMDAVLNSKEHKSLFASQYKKAGETMCAKHGKMDSCMADDDNDARKAKKDSDSDSSSAWDDNDARKAKKDSDSDSSSAWDDNDARKKKKDSDEDDSSYADDDDNDARKKKKDSDDESSSDSSDADDNNDEFGKGAPSGSGKGADPYVFPTDKITAKPPQPKDAQKPANPAGGSHAADDGFETSAAFDVAIDSLLTASAALDSVGLGRGSALTLKIASLVVEAKKKDKDSKKSKKDSKKDSKKSDSQSAKDKKFPPKKDSKDSKKSDKKDDKKSSKSSK